MAQKRPLRLQDVERAINLTKDLPGISLRDMQITGDPVDLARHNILIALDTDKFEASIYADNRGTDEAGPVQTYASVAANSAITAGDQLKLGIFTIPDAPKELLLADASYQLPLHSSGTYLTVSGMVSTFDAGAFLASFDTEATTKQVRVRLSHPFIRRNRLSLWGNLSVEGRNIKEEQLGLPQFEDKIRVVRASSFFQQSDGGGNTNAALIASLGIDMFDEGASGTSLSRSDADGQFAKIEGSISRFQAITDTIGIYGAARGQVAFDPLLASEEFAAGGRAIWPRL